MVAPSASQTLEQALLLAFNVNVKFKLVSLNVKGTQFTLGAAVEKPI